MRQNAECFDNITKRTPEFRLEAVKQNGMALRYILKKDQTLAIAIAALKQNPESRNFLATKYRTPEVYKAAGYDYKPEDLASKYRDTERGETFLSR